MPDEVNLRREKTRPQACFQLGFLGDERIFLVAIPSTCTRRPLSSDPQQRWAPPDRSAVTLRNTAASGTRRPWRSRPGSAFQVIGRDSERHAQQTQLIDELTVKLLLHMASGRGCQVEQSATAPSALEPLGGLFLCGSRAGFIQKKTMPS